MGKLYVLLAVSVLLAWLYDYTYVSSMRRHKRPEVFYIALVIILICFAGFRGAYNDTWNYRDIYTYLATGFPDAWDTISWTLGENPAFNIIQAWFKTYNTDVHLFLMFFSFWTVLIYTNFVKKYAANFVLTIYFFFTMGSYLFTLAAIKQCMATAFCLLAVPYALDKKWGRFLLLVGIGMLFHPYAAMFLIVPLMTFRPWSRGTCILLVLIVVGGFLFQPLLGKVIDITTAIGEEYTESAFTGQGVGYLRLAVCWTPVILSFIYRKILFANSSKTENVFINLSMVYAGILFIGLFGTALYFGRMSNYFSMMPVIALPWMLTKIKEHNPREGRLLTSLAVFFYFIYFYFSNTVETQFATSYEALTPVAFFEIFWTAITGGAA